MNQSRIELFVVELVDGMVECWSQLFSACKEEGRFEFLNKSLEKAGRHWIMALLAFAGHEKGRTSLGKYHKDSLIKHGAGLFLFNVIITYISIIPGLDCDCGIDRYKKIIVSCSLAVLLI